MIERTSPLLSNVAADESIAAVVDEIVQRIQARAKKGQEPFW